MKATRAEKFLAAGIRTYRTSQHGDLARVFALTADNDMIDPPDEFKNFAKANPYVRLSELLDRALPFAITTLEIANFERLTQRMKNDCLGFAAITPDATKLMRKEFVGYHTSFESLKNPRAIAPRTWRDLAGLIHGCVKNCPALQEPPIFVSIDGQKVIITSVYAQNLVDETSPHNLQP
jgi:hypothetical protein